MISKDLALSDNKRPAKFALTPAGYALAERLAPSAGVEVHVRLPSSSLGSTGHGGGHPSSSSGIPARGSAPRPDRFASGGSGHGSSDNRLRHEHDEDAYFPGLGTALGASTSGPSVLRNTSIHVAAPRWRQVTPDLFGGARDARLYFGSGPTAAANNPHGEVEEDPQYLEQLRRAIELSKKEAAGANDLPYGSTGATTSSANAARTASGSTGSTILDARKAAMGLYAVKPPRPSDAPAIKNVGACFLSLSMGVLNEDVC